MPIDVRARTERFVYLLWDCKAAKCLPYLSQDFSFVGPFNNTICFGVSELIQYCCHVEPIFRQLSFEIGNIKVVHENTSTYVLLVVGNILLSNDKRIARERYSFVWHKVASRIELTHLHASIPTLQADKGQFVFLSLPGKHGSSEQATQTLAADKPIFIRDTKGTVHAIGGQQTVYLEASHQYTIVHLRDDAFKVRCSLTELTSRLSPYFIRVHRSYTVNAHLVTSMKGPLITFVNGSTVSVAAKRVKETHAALYKAVATSKNKHD
ncbi:MAG: LytTR family DNA-binding domain-containing protein [Atopobiaceae bacterium]|jgi:hypothetical protein